MKIHTKKKATRLNWKQAAQRGLINKADGTWANRSSVTDNSMKRDFSPQAGSR